jgi:hypothetical protein
MIINHSDVIGIISDPFKNHAPLIVIRIEKQPFKFPFNFSNRFDGGTKKSSSRWAALIASSRRLAGRAIP